jgi:Undecaprenyl-phosphate galactose phosphotransferase WbaP
MGEQQLEAVQNISIPAIPVGRAIINRRNFMSFCLVAMDIFCLLLSNTLAIFLRFTCTGKAIPEYYREFSILLPMAVLIYLVSGLYNHNLSAVEELRRLSISTSIFFLCIAGIFFISKQNESLSRIALILSWLICMAAIPFGREVIRSIGVKMEKWGEPVVVFGNGQLGNEVADFLRAHPKMGFIPVAVVDRRKVDRSKQKSKVIHDQDLLSGYDVQPARFKGISTAFVVVPEISQPLHNRLIDEQTIQFERLIMVTSSQMTSSLCVQPLDIGGILGLQVGHNLLNKWQMFTKRMMDLTLIILSLPFTIPLFAITAALIRLDSPGSVFYSQDRIGYGGKHFRMWKFRSMHTGADEMLKKYLEENPDLREEWDATHKLKRDPRITRVGKYLRKFSLDEFPQLVNVFLGQMGLVGPRPIVNDEKLFYKKRFELYTHVVPGMTGMWQVSGRSDTSYENRVGWDEYYVRNWSIWLDLHILIRTAIVVLRGSGSY